MKRTLLLLLSLTLLLFQGEALWSQTYTTDRQGIYSDEYLDTVKVAKTKPINDYSMIGIQAGMGLSTVMWNPTMSQDMRISPYNFGIFYTRYGKMFGYMPYFGFQGGVIYSQEGYKFKADGTSGQPTTLEGADEVSMEVIEVPIQGHIHVDFWKMKLMANLGCFGGYRLSIKRMGESVPEEKRTSFLPTDRRIDYGVKAGAGFAFVFDPIEIHFTAMYKQSLSNLYDPDTYSQYYYRFSYPVNITFSVGIHYHITNRLGKTTKMMKTEAFESVVKAEEAAEASKEAEKILNDENEGSKDRQ